MRWIKKGDDLVWETFWWEDYNLVLVAWLWETFWWEDYNLVLVAWLRETFEWIWKAYGYTIYYFENLVWSWVVLAERNILVRGLEFVFGLGCLGWEKHLDEFEQHMGIYLVWLSGGTDNLDRWCVALAVAHWGVLCLGGWHSVEVEVTMERTVGTFLTVLDRGVKAPAVA